MERRARDFVTGEAYLVPGNLSYEDWKNSIDEKYGEGALSRERSQFTQEQAKQNADRRQWERFKKMLPDDTPKTMTAFTKMKYHPDSERYRELLQDYRRVNRAAKMGATFVR